MQQTLIHSNLAAAWFLVQKRSFFGRIWVLIIRIIRSLLEEEIVAEKGRANFALNVSSDDDAA